MPRRDVSAMWCVLGDGDRFCEDCGAPLGRCPSCGEPVMLGRSFSRFSGCRRPLAREQLLDGALDVRPVELRVRVPVVAPGLEAPAPARDE
jgi:hypothetical protein